MSKIIRIIVFLFGIILLVILGLFYIFKKNNNIALPVQKNITPTASTQTPAPTSFQQLESGNRVQWITTRDSGKISLTSNLNETLSSTDIKNNNGCLYLVSGGFYTDNQKHIGLFVSDSNKINDSAQNPTFNGYYSISRTGNTEISYFEPLSPRVALQSGPILYNDGKAVQLNIKNDENARRIVAATNRFNHTIFFVFYNASSTIKGPTLTELPDLLADLNKKTNLDFEDAINLDGGAHSAFLSDTVTLSELSPIGSYFCIKP